MDSCHVIAFREGRQRTYEDVIGAVLELVDVVITFLIESIQVLLIVAIRIVVVVVVTHAIQVHWRYSLQINEFLFCLYPSSTVVPSPLLKLKFILYLYANE